MLKFKASMDGKGLTQIERVVLIASPLVGVILSLGYGLPYLISIFLFYLLPGLYLDISHGTPRSIVKHLLFAIIISIPFAIIVDYIGTQSGLWYVPQSLFSNRFLDVIPYEDFFWMIAAVYAMIALYVHSEGRDEKVIFNKRMWTFILYAAIILAIFFVLIRFYPALFIWHTRWAYVILGIVFFLLPAGVWLAHAQNSFHRALPVVAYFFYFTLLFEITGTYLKDWIFRGVYLLPPLVLFGSSSIPYEELFFVGIIGPVAAIAFYEYFNK